MPDVVIPPTAQAGQILTSVGNGNQVQWKAPKQQTSTGAKLPTATTAGQVPQWDGSTWQAAIILPSGLIMDYAGSSTPTGWLLCDGSAYDTTTYASLFAAIGYTWGSSGGNFKVPDLRGVMTLGAGYNAAAAVTYTLATIGGAVTTTISTANLPSHSHTVNDSGHVHTVNITDTGHVHQPSGGTLIGNNAAATALNNGVTAGGGYKYVGRYSEAAVGVQYTSSSGTGISASAASATTGITTQNTGSGTAATTISPYAVTNKIIKT